MFYKNKYPVEVLRVIDGDTVEVLVDLGFHCKIALHIRMDGYNAHEVRGGTTFTKMLAAKETEYFKQVLSQSFDIFLTATKKRSFTRWVGELYFEGKVESINSLIAKFVISNTVKEETHILE